MSALEGNDSFTLRDVFVDALTSIREDWRAHGGWNLIWIAVAGVSCCGFTMLLGGMAAAMGFARSGGDTASRMRDLTGMAIVMYAVLLPMMFGLYAVHQSVTMTIVRARSRGAAITMRDGIQQGLARTPALVGHLMLRTLVEGVPLFLFYGIVLGIFFGAMGGSATGFRDLGAGAWALLSVAYLAVIVFAFGVRGFLGLAFACVVAGSGPWAAFGESVRLLKGRRWQFIRKRLAVFAAWMVGYAVCMGPFFASSLASGGQPNPAASLALLPLMLGFYAVMLFLIVIDAALESAYHVRVTRPLDATLLAATFD